LCHPHYGIPDKKRRPAKAVFSQRFTQEFRPREADDEDLPDEDPLRLLPLLALLLRLLPELDRISLRPLFRPLALPLVRPPFEFDLAITEMF